MMSYLLKLQMLFTCIELNMQPLLSCTLNESDYSNYIKRHINTVIGEWGDRIDMNNVGTQYVKQHNWPWVVALTRTKNHSDTTSNGRVYFCSGVLLTLDMVLTAAHCVNLKLKPIPRTDGSGPPVQCNKPYPDGHIAKHFRVLAGYTTLDATTEESCDEFEPKQHQVGRVATTFTHPSYPIAAPNCLFFDDEYVDLAILKLSQPLERSEFVKPICHWRGPAEGVLDPKSACSAFVVAGYGPPTDQLARRHTKQIVEKPSNVFSSEWVAKRLSHELLNYPFDFYKTLIVRTPYETKEFYSYGKIRKIYHEYFAPLSTVEYSKAVVERLDHQQSCADLAGNYPTTGVTPRCCSGPGWSGSPLMFVRNNSWYLYGILSGGRQRDTPTGTTWVPEALVRTYGVPTYFAQVHAYISKTWIENVLYEDCKLKSINAEAQARCRKRPHPHDEDD